MASKAWPKTDREWEAMLASKRKGFVRNAKQWETLAKSKKSPLAGLPKKAVDDFTKSLIFKDGGLAHANYGSIVDRLTYPQFKTLWQSFGITISLFDDHDGYWCSDRANCRKLTDNICMSQC